MKKIIAVLTGVFVVAMYCATIGAQAKSVKEGVYTDAQAKRGEMLYKDQCAACHGDDLAGSGPMPPLAGTDFVKNWENPGALFDKIHMSMPASSPGSLTEAQVVDVISYILSVGKYPAGTTELEPKMEPLMQITLEPKEGAPEAAGT